MSVDKGGLQYPIEIINKFEGTLTSFKQQIRDARKELEALRKAQSSFRGSSSSTTSTSTEKERKQLKLLTEQEQRLLEAKRKRLNTETFRTDKRVRQINAETEAIRRRTKAEQESNVKSILAAQGLGPNGKPLPKPPSLRGRIKELLGIGDASNKAAGGINRLSFTFRRLFGILAAFAAARAVIRLFQNFVKESITFNAKLEQVRLGIASLLTAVGTVTDAMGGTVSSAQALVLAQKEARRQTDLLRRDALKTTATFQQLADTFQIALAPGLQGGLNVNEIRKFAVRISQASAAIGLAQNQLAEEIRSILSGTIQSRTTRIAVALGITNEDIRRAREAGELADFLQERFAAFGVAGEQVAQTFTGSLNRVKDALQLLLGAGGIEFFEQLKILLKDSFTALTSIDPVTEILSPDPKAVQVVQEITNGLRDAVLEGARLKGAFDFKTALGTARALGRFLSLSAKVLGAIFEGVLKGVNDVRKDVTVIFRIIKAIVPPTLFNTDNAQKMISLISRILVTYLSVSFVLGLINKKSLIARALTLAWGVAVFAVNLITTGLSLVWGVITAGITAAAAASGVFATVMALVTAPITLIVAGVLAIAAGILFIVTRTFSWSDALESVKNKFKSVAKSVSDIFTDFSEGTDSVGEESKKLSELFAELPGIISRSNNPLQKMAALTKELDTNIRKANAELRTGILLLGLEGAVRDQLKTRLDAAFFVSERTREQKAREGILVEQLRGIESRREKIAIRVAKLSEEGQKRNVRAGEALKELADLEGSIASAKEAIAASEEKLKKATGEEAQELEKLLKAQKSFLAQATKSFKNAKARADLLISESQEGEKIKKIALEQFALAGRENAILTERESITKAVLEVEEKINDVIEKGIELSAKQNTLRLQQQSPKERLRIQNLTNDIRFRKAPKRDRDIAAAGNQLQFLREEFAVRQNLNALQDKSIAKNIAATNLRKKALATELEVAQGIKDNDTAINAIKKKQQENQTTINVLIQEEAQVKSSNLRIAKAQTLEIQKQRQELEQLLNERDRPLSTAFKDSILELANPDLYQEAFDVITEGIEGVSQAFAGTIVDLFDPAAEADLRERLGQLARSIAEQIISQIIQTLIASLVVKLLGLNKANEDQKKSAIATTLSAIALGLSAKKLKEAALSTAQAALATSTASLNFAGIAASVAAIAAISASGASSKGAGAHDGGNVGEVFSRARGYDSGGPIARSPLPPVPPRPAGLHPKDTVPIWADPSEWVIKGRSVALYGQRVMAAINQGLIDPYSLKALAGMHRPSLHAPPKIGFESGGPVSSAGTSPVPAASSESPSVMPAVLVADEDTAEMIFNGGSASILRWMEDNSDSINKALGNG